MGKEAQSVPAAALLYKKANEILGYLVIITFKLQLFLVKINFLICFVLYYVFRFDLLDVCINGPKEKLNSTVISQVCFKDFVMLGIKVLI